MITAGIVILLLAAVVSLAIYYGRQGVKKDIAEKTSKAKEKQLAALLNKPRDRSALLDRLRDGL